MSEDVLPYQPRRGRLLYGGLALLTVILGLASRHFSHLLPPLMAKNTGDVLYATMACWLVGLIVPRLSTTKVSLLALSFCFAIEFAKFIRAPALVAVRRQAWGHLIFGSGFHVSNLVCYGVGVLVGVGIELSLRRLWVKRAGGKVRV